MAHKYLILTIPGGLHIDDIEEDIKAVLPDADLVLKSTEKSGEGYKIFVSNQFTLHYEKNT